MALKKIAVLMATYNGQAYIDEQIQSILNQTIDGGVDLIVRDDGSSDDTQKILEQYQQRGQLVWSCGKNLGPAKGFMELLKANPGYEYYAFADQDDVWHADKLKWAFEELKGITEPALYCSNAEMVDERLAALGRMVHRSMGGYSFESVFCGFTVAQGCTIVINSKFADIIQSHSIPERMIMHDSFLTMLIVALNGLMIRDERASLKYRMHSNNTGGLKTRQQVGILWMIKGRIRYIFRRWPLGCYEQAAILLDGYKDVIPAREQARIKNFIAARTSLLRRTKLAASRRLYIESLNLSVANRIRILLNRI